MDVGAMNAFQKQQLSQATGMDIEQLMSLQQGGEGGVKGTLEQKAAEKTGRDIANGALNMEIAHEKDKMAREIAHQKEMMEFERDTKKAMLFVEQAQRLENLAIEAKWRLKYAELDSEEKIAMAVADMQKESASKWYNNMFRDAAQQQKNNIAEQLAAGKINQEQYNQQMSKITTSNAEAQAHALSLVQAGILTADNAQATMTSIGTQIAQGKQLDMQSINQMLTNDNAFTKRQEELVTQQQDAAAKAEAAKAELEKLQAEQTQMNVSYGVGTLGIGHLTDWIGGMFGADVMGDDKRQARIEELKGEIQKQSTVATTSGEKLDDVKALSAQSVKNDDIRGIVFKKQYDYQARLTNEGVKAAYVQAEATRQLASAITQQEVSIDATGVKRLMNQSLTISNLNVG
jgi:hypothetical protein